MSGTSAISAKLPPLGNRPVVFALVGGVASGKSAVSRAFEKLGARVIDADVAGDEVLEDPLVKKELVDAFGDDVIDKDGEVSRKRLGALAFEGPTRVMRLNTITHPRIKERTAQKLTQAITDKKLKAVVLDVSLLLDNNYDGKYDVLVFVDCSEATREERANSRAAGCAAKWRGGRSTSCHWKKSAPRPMRSWTTTEPWTMSNAR